MALNNSLHDLKEDLAAVEYDMGIATHAHLRAVDATNSMQSNSQRRAQARNTVAGLYERRRALRDAIEIYEHYPNMTFESGTTLS